LCLLGVGESSASLSQKRMNDEVKKENRAKECSLQFGRYIISAERRQKGVKVGAKVRVSTLLDWTSHSCGDRGRGDGGTNT